MTEKRYVFIPEPTKHISVFNAKNSSLTNYTNFNQLKPDLSFKYNIDEFDKVKLFYINGRSEEGSIDDFSYLNSKTQTAIKSLFKVDELSEFELILDDENPRIEFTIFYDIHGLASNRYKLAEHNNDRTLLAHTYIYNIYKRYNLK